MKKYSVSITFSDGTEVSRKIEAINPMAAIAKLEADTMPILPANTFITDVYVHISRS